MTQQEYKEKLFELETKIKELNKQLEIEKNKNFNYEKVLEDYYIINQELKSEREICYRQEKELNVLSKQLEDYKDLLKSYTIKIGG